MATIKYGIIYFKETENLGDDIQTYAAIKFLPKIDYVIEREKLCTFLPDKNEMITTILNGWYMHDLTAFPPSPFINPLIISTHFTDSLSKKKPIYFDNFFYNYLKKYEPIGLRDNLIKEYLDEEKIKNYFSGCLTLTIEPFENINQEDKICLADVDGEIVEKVKKTSKYKSIITTTHKLNSKINSLLTFEERMKNVEEQLKLYQSSKLVITSRLHVALPCLALKVPVLLIYDDSNLDVKNRLSSYLDLLNHTSKSSFLDSPNYNIKVKNEYTQYKESLEQSVHEFINKSKDIKYEEDESIELYYKYFICQKERINRIHKFKEKQLVLRINEYEKLYNRLSMVNELYLKEEEIRKANSANLLEKDLYIEELNKELNNIKTSKGYRLLEIIRKIKRKIIKIIKLGR